MATDMPVIEKPVRPGGMREAIKSAAHEGEQGVLNRLSNSAAFCEATPGPAIPPDLPPSANVAKELSRPKTIKNLTENQYF